MNGQIIYMSELWLQKKGDFEAHVTPVGGLMLIHEKMKIPSTRLVHLDQVFPKYLAEDLENDCTLFYIGVNQKVLGNINFRNWLFEASGARKMITFARMGNKKSITFSPRYGQIVPRQAVALAFRFEVQMNDARYLKYFLHVPIVRDMRVVLPPPTNKSFASGS